MSSHQGADPLVSFDELTRRRMGRVRRFMRTHPRFVVVATVLVYLMLSLLGLVGRAIDPELDQILMLAGILATALALLFRLRYPMLVLLTVFLIESSSIVLDAGGGGYSGIGMMIALYTVGTKYSGRRTIPIALFIGAFHILLFIMTGYPDVSKVLDEGESIDDYGGAALMLSISGGFMLGSYVAAAAVGTNIRNARIHDAEINHWASQVSRLAQVQERHRIAREMHDVVAHSLSVMIALSDGARVVAKKDAVRAETVLAELSGTGRAALADMRRLLGVLRQADGAELSPQPSSGNLEQMLDGFRVAGLPLTYSYTGEPLPKDTTFELTVYRIIQESLTNALRYAHGASYVQVRLNREPQWLVLEIIDDGDGTLSHSVGSGQGLSGMRERAALFDGTVEAGPRPEGGWIVSASLRIPKCDSSLLEPKTNPTT
ncbi:histidine kinase [Glutamicibacter endophyticus]